MSAHECNTFALGDHAELGQQLLVDVQANSEPPIHDEGDLYEYSPASGLWLTVPRERQSVIIQGYSGTPVPTVRGNLIPLKIGAKDVAGVIQLAGDRAHVADFFRNAPKGIAFSNGFVRVTAAGIDVLPHSPEHHARIGHAFPYVKSDPLQFLAFLGAIFANDADKTERIAFTQEFFGACLLGIAPVYGKAQVSISDGESGRTTAGKIMESAFPDGSITSIPPQNFQSEYSRAKLRGKLLNFVAELPETEILDSESFKAIITGDMIEARPIRCAPFDFRPIAGHFYAANRMPATKDLTHAFWRRFIVLRFTRQFKEGDKDRDPNIAERIIKDEREKIVPWLIEGAARVLAQSGYTIPPSSRSELDKWKHGADSVAQFIAERLVKANFSRPEAGSDWMTATQLYNHYRIWVESVGIRTPLAMNKFCERLVMLNHARQETKTGSYYQLRARTAKDADDAQLALVQN